MVAKKKKGSEVGAGVAQSNPEGLERKRLKTLAFSSKILSQTPAKPSSHLLPSKAVSKHHGRDIVKKSQRRNRFLFSFPGLLAPISGGKIGELKDLGTKNPVLYLEFPQGRMKLFGTIVYPKNRYLTLQFPRGGASVMCEDYFDNMIVFADAWWIGTEAENPEESRLDFPEELNNGQNGEHDFKGGAGGAQCTNNKPVGQKIEVTNIREQSPDLEDDSSDGEIENKEALTPVRQSARNVGKKFRFAEATPEDDSISSDSDENEDVKKKEKNSSIVFDIDDEEEADKMVTESPLEIRGSTSIKINKSKEESTSHRGSLVQTTISTLFKKVEERKTPRSTKKTTSPEDSDPKPEEQKSNHKRKIIQEDVPKKKAKVTTEKIAGVKGKAKKKVNESDEDDDIEEYSSASQNDDDESDEDWAA